MVYVVEPGRDGVEGDGVLDDTDALNAIFASDPWVAFAPDPAATYAVSTLRPAPDSRVRGGVFSSVGGKAPLLDFSGADHATWVGGYFDGSTQADGSETVVRIADAVGVVFRGAYVVDGYQNGVVAYGDAKECELCDVAVFRCGNRAGVNGSDLHGVKWMGPRGLIRRCVVVENGYCRSYGDKQPANTSGIKVLGQGSGTRLLDNRLEANGGKGVEVGADRCLVARNEVILNEEVGVFGRECRRLVIRENLIVGNLNNGIDVNTVEDCRVDDNECLYNGSSRNDGEHNQEGSGIFVNSCIRGRVTGNDCFGNSQGQTDSLPAFGGDGRSGIRFSDKGDPTYGFKVNGNVCTDPRETGGFTATLAAALEPDSQELQLTDVVGRVPDDGPFTVLVGKNGSLEGVICRRPLGEGRYAIWRAENNSNGVAHDAGTPVSLEKTQKYGIHQKGGADVETDDYQITGNDVRGNRSGGVRDNSGLEDDAPIPSPSRLIRGNLTDA